MNLGGGDTNIYFIKVSSKIVKDFQIYVNTVLMMQNY